MTSALPTAFCGVLCILASGCVGLHEILLGPDRPNYPTGSRRTRMFMGVWSVALLYRGVEFMSAAFGFSPAMTITSGQIFSSCTVCLVHASLLEDHLRKWLPAKQQERIRRWRALASCGRATGLRLARRRSNEALEPGVPPGVEAPAMAGQALAELALDGWPVAAPCEGPEVIVAPIGLLSPNNGAHHVRAKRAH